MRQLVSEKMPDGEGMLCIEGRQFFHLKSVLRASAGDMVNVRLADGSLVAMTVCRVENDKLVLQKTGASAVEIPLAQAPKVRLWLFQFAPKPAKMELIVRQATECGVEKIIPIAGEFCQKGSLESLKKKSDRWERIILEAREQSGSPVNTSVEKCLSLEEALSLWQTECSAVKAHGASASAVCLYERNESTVPLHEALRNSENCLLCALAVGAEGGISPDEYRSLCKGGFTGVHFATNILRCETAALYGMAAVQTALMEKKIWQ